MTVATLPKTRCGLPFGSCGICNPEQQIYNKEERRWQAAPLPTRGSIPHNIGDNNLTCPAEWSKPTSLATARRMLDDHGAVVAMKKARKFQMSYIPGTWGHKGWQYAIDWLRART